MDMDMDTRTTMRTSTSTAMTDRTRRQVRTSRPRRPTARQKRAATPLAADALLQLMWLASPALPVGGFSYSEGLESAVETGLANDEAKATRWLVDQLHLGLAPSELAVVGKAMAAWQRADVAAAIALNDWVLATRESSEMAQQATQMGRSLALWIAQRHPADARVAALAAMQPSPTWPIAFALAAAQIDAPAREALLAFAFGWAENMIQAAVKSIPLGQSAGQRMLAALVAEMPVAVDHALALDSASRQAFMPMLAIVSARHESQYSRLFRS
jgi:urease accessory protein